MLKINSELFQKKAKELDKIINKHVEKKVMIFHDTDMDGIASAVLLSKYLLSRGYDFNNIDYWYLKSGPRRIDRELIGSLKSKGYGALFILDIAGDEFSNVLVSLNIDIVIIDHHILYVENIKENVIIIKPQNIGYTYDPSTYPTSKLLYDLLSYLSDKFNKYKWIAELGVIGDLADKKWNKFVEDTDIKYKAEKLISFYVAEDINNVYDITVKLVNKYRDVYDIIKDLKEYAFFQKKLDELFKFCNENKIETDHYLLCEVKCKYDLKSQLANLLSSYSRDKTIILLYDKGDENIYISLRNQSGKIPLGNLLSDISNTLKGKVQGGGHKPAAGAVVKKKYKDDFIDLLLKKLEKAVIDI